MSVLAGLAGEVMLEALSLGLRSTDEGAVNRFHVPSITYIGCLGKKKGLPKQPLPCILLARLGQTLAANGLLTISFATGTSLVPSPSLPVSAAP